MELTQSLNMKEVTWRYLVANTPRYLYKHLRRESSIQDLKTRWSSQELAAEFNQRAQRPERTMQDTAAMYAILIGFTFFEYSEACAGLEGLNLATLEWGEWMFNFFRSTAKITQSYVKKAETSSEKIWPNITSSDSLNQSALCIYNHSEGADNAEI